MEISFKELHDYLDNNNCFGLTASRRKNTIIYYFKRYFVSLPALSFKIKVDRKTKNVISVMNKNTVYTDFENVKKLVEENGQKTRNKTIS